MSTTHTKRALELVAEGNIRGWFRLSFERLFFTQRGRFASLFGTMLVLVYRVDYLTYTATPTSDVLVNSGLGEPWATIGPMINGGLILVGVVLAGLTVLLLMDMYELEVGPVADPDDSARRI